MGKRELANVRTDLSALAALMPDHKPAAPKREPREPREAPAARPRPKPKERIEQVNVSMRAGLRKDLIKLALDADMTVRAFVLDALKAKGLKVRDDDLTDLRKRG